jgi:hypothetical protein
MTDDGPIDWSNVEPEERRLSLSTLRFSDRTQPREEIDPDWVGTLAEKMKTTEQGIVVDRGGEDFPPLAVFYDGSDYWVADGHHRGRAARQKGIEQFQTHLYQGDESDAILYAVGANAKHGQPRSDGDVQRATYKLLLDEEWRYWSDREIARQCNVHHSTVSEHRQTLMERDPEYRKDVGDERTYEYNGETRQMDISGRGGSADNGGDDDISATWSPSQSVHKRGKGTATEQVDEADTTDESGADDTGDPPQEDESLDTRLRANFREEPALQCADYCKYDPIGDTTVAAGAPIRQALEEVAPIDLIVTHGPDDDSEHASMVEAAAHTLSDNGLMVVTMTARDHADRSKRLQQRFTHQRTQLIDDQPWRLATVWHHDLNLPDRYDMASGSWPEWSGSLYRPWMSAIAVPYARGAALAAGLMGDERSLTTLTNNEEDTDEIIQTL